MTAPTQSPPSPDSGAALTERIRYFLRRIAGKEGEASDYCLSECQSTAEDTLKLFNEFAATASPQASVAKGAEGLPKCPEWMRDYLARWDESVDPLVLMNDLTRWQDPPPYEERWAKRVAAACEVAAYFKQMALTPTTHDGGLGAGKLIDEVLLPLQFFPDVDPSVLAYARSKPLAERVEDIAEWMRAQKQTIRDYVALTEFAQHLSERIDELKSASLPPSKQEESRDKEAWELLRLTNGLLGGAISGLSASHWRADNMRAGELRIVHQRITDALAAMQPASPTPAQGEENQP